MPRFHQVGLSFTAYFLILFFYGKYQEVDFSFWAYFIPACILIYLGGKGAVNINSNFFVKAICSGKTKEKWIALTFDDGPDASITPQVLDLLKKL